jgi:molybdenum cofactor cytidylyltransferase
MRFGSVALDQALGAILAHAVAMPDGVLRKGTLLGPSEIAALRATGRDSVIVARLDPDDLHEDAAAARIGVAMQPAGQGLRASPAATGRVNLYALGAGVLAVDQAAVTALNRINPMITLACLRPWARVAAGSMVATVKIISYGVAGVDVDRACTVIGPALQIRPPVLQTATLIETTIGVNGTLPDPGPKGRAALTARLARLGVRLTARRIVAHDAAAIAGAVTEAAATETQMIFILTASATSDPMDVGPAAVWAAGGQVMQFGIPVDPGNLLFLGSLGHIPVIGLPGCARSPALNGADWVLERVICGVPVSPDDLAAMGVGGLLKETPARGRLRESAPDAE